MTMHELSLAEALLNQIEEITAKEKASEVVSVRISIGALSGVERDAFEFALPIVAEGTVLSNCDFAISEIPVKVKCEDCLKESFPEMPTLECVECGSANVDIIEGKELTLTSMEIR